LGLFGKTFRTSPMNELRPSEWDPRLPPGGLPPHEGIEPAAPPVQTRGKWWWLKRSIQALLLLIAVLIAWLALTAPLSKSLEPIAPPQITLLAADGTPFARNGAIVDKPVKAAELPPHVKQAFIAIEDRRFYSHWGVDPRSIARAVVSNITSSRTQGGSTITQQLAKFTFLSPERSLTRKAREALIAFWLEAWLSKDEILERYLSNAYFGDNTYGLRAASLHYFYRQPERLTPAQAAMLAGLVQAPSRLAPTRNYAAAKKRMELVKAAMVAEGYLTADAAARMPFPQLDLRSRNELPSGTYFADWVLPQIRAENESGYARETLKTTLDTRLQRLARNAIARAGLGQAQAALVAMRPTGEVVAMVGGRDYAASPFNRATQARRQPGSTFKLFVYLAALKEGWQPDDRIDNRPILTGGYRPKNYAERYSDSITLREAFATSSNVATVRLFNQVGDRKVIALARAMGVTAPMEPGDPSVALGTSEMTLLELTAAYAGVAGNSYPVKPRAFPAEEQGWFEWLVFGPSRLSGRVHEDVETMLRRTVEAGTGRAAAPGRAAFGKTGTSQDNRDALFVGYSGDLVVGVWVGNDDNTPLQGVTGGGLPAKIWRDFMRSARGAPPAPARPRSNPSGPVEPLDGPEALPLPEIPLGDARVRFEDGRAVISTEVGGAPVGVNIDLGPEAAEAQRRAAAALREASARSSEAAREAQRRIEEEASRRAQGPG
jgi:penicillin-binding protein 1A